MHAGLRTYKPGKRRNRKHKLSRRRWYGSVGRELGFERGDPAHRAGMWAWKLLRRLPIFELSEDGQIEIRLDGPEVREIIKDAANYMYTRRPQLLPLKDPPCWAPAGATDVLTDAEPVPPNLVGRIDPPKLVTHHHSVIEQFNADIAWGRGRNVLDALDWMQQTPFTINKPILKLLQRMPPRRVPQWEPRRPEKWDTEDGTQNGKKLSEKAIEAAAARKSKLIKRKKHEKLTAKQTQDAVEHHFQVRRNAWMRRRAKWLNFHWTVQDAEILCDEHEYPDGEFFNILKLDLRGRLVALHSFAYQADDANRALFLFKNGAEIGRVGIRYLKAHVAARACGWKHSDHPKPDKLNLQGRIDWTERHLGGLLRIGECILTEQSLEAGDLPEEDECYQFAAACVELALLARTNYSTKFKTHLPLVFDASCSGLQHIAFALRSEDIRFANGYPDIDGKPSDLYEKIAEWIRNNTKLLDGIDERHHRKIVKRPVMTQFYGSTTLGKMLQIYEVLVDITPLENRTDEFYQTVGKRAYALAEAVTKAIPEIVPSISQFSTFVTNLCGKYTVANKPMKWRAPWLTLLHAYYTPKWATSSHGSGKDRTRTDHVVGYTNNIDPEAVSKVAANVTHSMDAALMHAVAKMCHDEQIPIAPIHDCWATLACHAERLNWIIRDRMIWVHKHDWLGEMYRMAVNAGIDLTDIPDPATLKGTYDPEPNFRESYFNIS